MSGQRTTDLLLVRHGLPVSGTADPGLSETGQRQARMVAAWIAAEPVDALFSSPLRRARETAAPLADLVGHPATIVPDLREWGSDTAIYTAPEEIDPADPRAIALAQGRYEDFLPKIDVPAFRTRAHSAVTALLDQADGGRIVAVSHGGLINAALATLLGTPRTFWFNPGYTSICRVRRLPSGATVLCAVNETAHLRSGPPAREPVVGWENLGGFRLDPTDEADLLDRQTECTLIWSDGTGHPLGAVVNYLVRDGRFWLTATDRRPRVAAIRRDPRVSIAISSRGSGIPHRRSLTVRGHARVHDGDDVKAWFLPALAERMRPGDGERQIAFARHLDSPGRVVIEVVPERLIGFDGTKMWATAADAAPVEADDRHAITEVLLRYTTALDTRDWPSLVDVFTPHAEVDYGTTGAVSGPDEVTALVRRLLAPLDRTRHDISDVEIQVDGDRAHATSRLRAEHVRTGVRGGDAYTIGGSYADELARTPAGWRIVRRRLHRSWTTGNPAVITR